MPMIYWKLDGVGPVDNRPSTDKLHNFVWKKNRHVTCDMRNVTRDRWHVTCDTWHVTSDMLWGFKILSKFQPPSSCGLGFIIFWRFGGKWWLTDWVNHKGVFRTAPTTPGLLNTNTLLCNTVLKIGHFTLININCILNAKRCMIYDSNCILHISLYLNQT